MFFFSFSYFVSVKLTTMCIGKEIRRRPTCTPFMEPSVMINLSQERICIRLWWES